LSLTPGLLLVLLVAPSTVDAAPPRAAVSLGAGSRFLTGDLGRYAQRGIGLSLSQELRSEYFGGRVELGASYFLTDQPTPPLTRELELYTVALGPQIYLPIGPVKIVVGLDYRHLGIVSNSLEAYTGPEINHSAAGGTVEVRYPMAPFEVMLRGGYHTIFGLDGSLISIDLAVGLSN
jgi:hypothetical protein